MHNIGMLAYFVQVYWSSVPIAAFNYYVGGIHSVHFIESPELNAILGLAVDLVNNKTDGWLDYETRDVNLVMRINASDAGGLSAAEVLNTQIEWAKTVHNQPLVGLIEQSYSKESILMAEKGND